MSFTQSQLRKLHARLRPQHIRTRELDGVSLSYLEGWHVVAEANRIFGFDGWDRETISSDCVWTKQVDSRYCAAYVARIRIRVRAGEAVIVREGSGAGESRAPSPGQAHEFAVKAAETDATKRALMTFGNAFGLSLYGGALDTRLKASAPDAKPPQSGPDERVSFVARRQTAKEDYAPPMQPSPIKREGDLGVGTADLVIPPAVSLPVSLPVPGLPHVNPLKEVECIVNERRARVDKSALAIAEPRRVRSSGHLALVASKPCLICGQNRAHAHHLKFAQPTALGRKVSDEFTVPLCATHHRELHQHGDERVWWAAQGIDALKVAEELWSGSSRSLLKNS